MKIKAFFSVLALAFFCVTNFVHASVDNGNINIVEKNRTSTEVKENLSQDVVIKFVVDYSNQDKEQNLNFAKACSIEGSLTLTTENGNSVSISFTITASTCQQATKAYVEFMSAWAKAQH